MRIALRNTQTRQDAAYILDAVGLVGSPGGDDVELWLTAYWGKWPAFLRDQVFGLRKQEKYHGPSRVDLVLRTQEIVNEKIAKGYRIQGSFSQLPQWNILPYGQCCDEYID